MSKEAVETVIGKAMMEADFRKFLLTDPEKALAGFDLTEAEKVDLKKIDEETLGSLANTLDARVSKAVRR